MEQLAAELESYPEFFVELEVAIFTIQNDGAFDFGEMLADLVAPPCFNLRFDDRAGLLEKIEGVNDLEKRFGGHQFFRFARG